MMATQKKEGPLDEMGCMAQHHIKTLHVHVVTITTELKGCFRIRIVIHVPQLLGSRNWLKKRNKILQKFFNVN